MGYNKIPLVVVAGGSGTNTLTGILTGNGTSAFTVSAVTQHNVLLGSSSNLVTSLAPSATSGVPLISQGSSSDPTFGTAVVAGGGTGNTTFTAYSLICAGTTATGAFQNVSGLGTSGFVLTSSGAGALPVWSANPGTGAITTINGNTGSVTPSAGAVTINGGTTGLTTSGSGSTLSLTGTLIVANGGTGATTLTGVLTGNGTSAFTASAVTNHNVLLGGSSNAITSVAPSATTGIALVSQGAATDPSFGTVVPAGGGTGTTTAFTTGSVVFAGASGVYTQDNANFFWDATNHRLGIGTAVPKNALDVNGALVVGTGAGVTTGPSNGLLVSGTVQLSSLTASAIVSTDASKNLTNLTIPLTVSNGGSGHTSVSSYALLAGGTSSTAPFQSVSGVGTTGQVLNSNGASALPTWGTAAVAGGGTGNTTFTAYSVICAGTTATGAFQNVSGLGSSGQFLQSAGAGALPVWASAPSSGISTLTADNAGTATGSNVTITGGSTGLTTTASSSTLTVVGTLNVAHGGTGATSLTSYGIVCGGTTTTGVVQEISPSSSVGQVLISQGVSALPIWVGGMSLVSSQTASSSASIIFTSLTLGSYYLLIWYGANPATGGASLEAQMSNDNGSTWVNSGYFSGINYSAYNSASLSNANSTSAWLLANNVINGADPSASGYAYFTGVNLGAQPTCVGHSSWVDNGSSTLNNGTFGGAGGNTGMDALKVFFSSGNVANGIFNLYALTN